MRKYLFMLPAISLLVFPNCIYADDVIYGETTGVAGDVSTLQAAIRNARAACSGISDSMADLKKMAGINTAVTAVGTVAGGVALGTGIAKASKDREYDDLKEKVEKLIKEKSGVEIQSLEIADMNAFKAEIAKIVEDTNNNLTNTDVDDDLQKMSDAERKSKTLGHIRTGGLATSTATNIAGTVIAANNKVDNDLSAKIAGCIGAIQHLSNARLAAKVEGTGTPEEITKAEKIVDGCSDYSIVDLKPINNRAKGAAISSGVGVGTGAVGVITSVLANTDKVRYGDDKKEKKLNTTANVMAGASTAASAVATIFNATQISAIKKVATVADACEEALR